ncbi:MAG TPA: helicase-related protein, partial [Puia sp.]|nr:helicase-related protein [Puia sp.]
HKVSADRKSGLDDSRRLFGNSSSWWEAGKPKDGYHPPDLIIQDELHLMLGPLGSAVALFESAIDQLSMRRNGDKPLRPKVISSTATTRNTPLQIMALFDRNVNLFPKPGINCDDSFFAYYKRKPGENEAHSYSSKRKYIGILPTGRTQMWMQLRLAAILFTHRALFERQELGTTQPFDTDAYSKQLTEAIDNYHTVLAYFNSLREVGKTESQIYSYLIKEIRRVFHNVARQDKLMQCFYTYATSFHAGELTGRLSGEEVVEQKERINERWSAKKRSAHQEADVILEGSTPPDLVIATNMISVGIDISRLNCMIMNCMPRNIAEYIQASSRVARDKPGLVITVHHPFRTRDLSHYERFIAFHEKMYSYVEPISITPFTRKALERYLPLYIATILRHLAGFPDRHDAANIPVHKPEELLQQLVGYFDTRTKHLQDLPDLDPTIKRLLTPEDVDQIKIIATRALKAWADEYRMAKEANQALVFNNLASNAAIPQRQLYIDIDEYADNIHSVYWRIPQSLRVVEPEAVIHVKPK